MPRNNDKEKEHKKHTEVDYKHWLEAQIALQQEALKSLKDKESRRVKEGQIALKELVLKNKRKR